jgi:hypothetical protein
LEVGEPVKILEMPDPTESEALTPQTRRISPTTRKVIPTMRFIRSSFG